MRKHGGWLVALVIAGQAGAEPPRITFFKGLGGQYPAAGGYAVSSDGRVVVGDTTVEAMFLQAFRWTERDGMALLRTPESLKTVRSAQAVSMDGAVVVGYDGWGEACRWTERTGLVRLGFLPGDDVSGFFGISADGNVLVGSSGTNGLPRAMYWTERTGMVGLGFLPGGGWYSTATGASADGRVIVGYSDPGSVSPRDLHAFRWTAEEGMVDLGDFPGGENFSYAAGVSDDGSVVIGLGCDELGGKTFRWTAETGMVSLGVRLWPRGMSGDGTVIAANTNAGFGYGAAFWTERTGLQDLRQWLMKHGVPGLKDAWLSFDGGHSVSSDGRTMVGSGPTGGGFIAYLGTPCEADCNDDGALDVDDFVCFQTFFGRGSLVADCDKSGSLDIDDFICFRSAFGAGCP